MLKQVTEFVGKNYYANRSATVLVDSFGDYGVKFVYNSKEIFRYYPSKSIFFVEDTAENWIKGKLDPEQLMFK